MNDRIRIKNGRRRFFIIIDLLRKNYLQMVVELPTF
jgi:hypothetical protein